MKITFNKNVLIGFALSLGLLMLSSVASYISIRNLLESYRWVNHTRHVMQELEMAMSSMKDAETGQRGYLLTGDNRFLEPYESYRTQVFQSIERVKALTADNELQRQAAELLHQAATKRAEQLQMLIERRRKGVEYRVSDLELGKRYMDEMRRQVKNMQQREEVLLKTRQERQGQFAMFTPALIVIAAVLSLVISVFFYVRVKRDFEQKTFLQKQLMDKDADMTHRIQVIQGVANKISLGEYGIRVSDTGQDGLGDLSFSLNRMAASLQESFNLLSQRDWLQTGINGLNLAMSGEQDIARLSDNIVSYITHYTNSQVGCLYLLREDRILELSGSYALTDTESRRYIPYGSGAVGQCAADRKPVLLADIKDMHVQASFASADIRLRNLYLIPILFENRVKGVLEIGSVHQYPAHTADLLTQVSERAGIVLDTTQNRTRLQELFEETQSQAEELQSQHSELENLNAELEAQALKLQASEEELKVQQEELLQTNQELEERSHLLAERNEQVLERNQEIQQHAAQLAQSTRYKSEFLANMSHELRTPLNSILLLSRLLAENNEGNMNREQVEYASVIQSSGNGLLTLIDEILDLSKIEAGKMEAEYTDVSVTEVAGDLQALFLPVAQEKQLDFRIQIGSEATPVIRTDKQRLEQILKNLIANAIKFTADGYVRLEIVPGATADTVRFSVKDTGIGIAPDKQRAIFEAFQQADGSTRRKFGGTGLGLAISRELAKLLGGHISLVSSPGLGSEFILELPAKPADPADTAGEATGHAAAFLREETSAEYDAALTLTEIPEPVPDDRAQIGPGDKVVLIVEDDTGFARALLDISRQKGYKGIVSVRGDEALLIARKYKPLAILLDIQLPVRNGWEVMEALKSDPETRHIPVHTMSSFDARRKSLIKGAVDFINKPVAADQLQDVFRKLEQVLTKQHKKVLITEENPKHARALAYFLETFDVQASVSNTIGESLDALAQDDVDCVILDMGIPGVQGYDMLEAIRNNPGMEDLPIIVFTGRNLSSSETQRLKQYADSIVMKTAHSYQRILDEVSLFLHLVEQSEKRTYGDSDVRPGSLTEILQGKTVLVTDDDVRNIYSLTRTLEKHRMKVLSATDGQEALRILEDHPETDIVLMDIMMPEMDGYEAMRQIRNSPKLKHLPVIAVTAKAMIGDREKSIQAGASDYISKPVDIDQLLSLLRVWLYDKI